MGHHAEQYPDGSGKSVEARLRRVEYILLRIATASPEVLPADAHERVAEIAAEIAGNEEPAGIRTPIPYDWPEDLAEALNNVTFRFWTCPAGCSNRHGDANRPVQTVEWRGKVAYCLHPGCGRTSADESVDVYGHDLGEEETHWRDEEARGAVADEAHEPDPGLGVDLDDEED